MRNNPHDDDLVGLTEIGERLGVSRQLVSQWRKRHADFPAPIAQLAMGPVWRWEAVKRWARSR